MNQPSPKSDPVVINIPTDYKLRRFSVKTRTVLILIALTMLMLTAIAEPIGWSPLAWFALIPWTIANAGAQKYRRAALINYIFGLLYFLANLYWLAGVTTLGWIALCFYLACYFPLAGFIVRRIYLKYRWPFTFVLPILWVALEYLRAIVMTGFPWFFLAHSQHANLSLIQISDLGGAYALTFIIAMVNGLLADMLLRPLKRPPKNKPRPALGFASLLTTTALCLTATILYGRFRLSQSEQTTTPGPKLTLIQEVVPQYVKEAGQSDEDILARHINLSNLAMQQQHKPDLIVWPETVTAAPLNKDFLNLNPDILTASGMEMLQKSLSVHKQLLDLSQKNVAVLIGAPALQLSTSESEKAKFFNSAILYLPNGRRFPQRYDKMHRVPFGEVVPFKHSWPWLHKLLNKLTPYDYDYTLDSGTDPTVFEFTTSKGTTAKFAVAICYEDVIPYVPRQLAAVKDGKKRIDFLLNISNDGWFVRGGKNGKPVTKTSELIQHLAICRFRAVENRIAIARAVNCGISAFIKPDGSLQHTPLAGTLPNDPQQRQITSGFITDHIYLDSRTTIYAQIGDSFAIIATILTALLLIASLRKRGKVSS